MAGEAARLFISVGADVKGAIAGLKDVDHQLERTSSKGESMLKSLGESIAGFAKRTAIVTTAVTGAIGTAVAVTGIQFNAMKEQALVAFETMLGSGEKAQAFLQDLQRFAAKTPFEFPELVQASQKLLAFGFNAEQVLPLLTSIGDAVAGLGLGAQGIDQVTRALGQMHAKGKASGEEMLQLTEAGIPAWRYLAEAIGTDVAGAMDLVSKGAVKSETVIRAVTEGMNRDFGGLMEKQSRTFNGLLSNIKDTFQQISGTVMAPFFEMVTRGLGWLAEFMASPKVTGAAERLASLFEQVGTAFKIGLMGAADDGLPRLATGFGTVARAGEVVREVVGGTAIVLRDYVVPAVKSFADTAASAIAGGVGQFIAFLRDNRQALIDIATAAAAAIAGGVGQFIEFLRDNRQTLLDIATAVLTIAVDLGTFTVKVMDAARETLPWKEALVGARDALGEVLEKVSGFLGPLADLTGKLSSNKVAVELATAALYGGVAAFIAFRTAAAISAVIGAVSAMLTSGLVPALIVTASTYGIGTAAATAFNLALAAVGGPVGLALIAIAALVAGIIVAIRHWDDIKKAVGAAWDFISSTTVKAAGAVWQTITDVFNRVKDFLGNNWREIVSLASFFLIGPGGLVVLFATNAFGIRDTVVGAFTSMKDWVLSRLSDLKDGALNLLGNLKDGAVSLMKGMVNNAIVDPLNSGLRAFGDLVNGLARAVNWVSNKLGLGDVVSETWRPPQIPRLARGTRDFPGGLAIVGEQGPELVVLPPHAAVFTARQTEALMEAMSQGVAIGGLPSVGDVVNAVKRGTKAVKDFVSEWVKKGAEALVDAALGAVGFSLPSLPGVLAELPGRAFGLLKDKFIDVVWGWLKGAKQVMDEWTRPLASYVITQWFGLTPFSGVYAGGRHTGVDLAVPMGTPVYAATSGEVTNAGWLGGYGIAVSTIRDDLQVIYGHLQRAAVALGEFVTAGELIGYADSTGFSTGPHLHFEVRRNGIPVDPTQFVALANGGLVNQPTLALLAERQPEVVAPEPMLRRIIREEAGETGGDIYLTVQIGDEKLVDKMKVTARAEAEGVLIRAVRSQPLIGRQAGRA